MYQTCLQCSASFEITNEDLAFYDKVSPVFNGKKELIPPPTLCPDCRMQRRLAHHNHRVLHKRTSDSGDAEIIAVYAQDAQVTVFEPAVWWGDGWDPLSFGKPVDRNRSMLEQMRACFTNVPAMSLFVDSNENSPYVNDTGWAKNCHLCFGADYCEDCMYCESVYQSRSTVDSLYCYNTELSYECVDCKDGYGLLFSQGCENCTDSAFLFDCIGCRNCFGCAGLRRKQYCWFNEQLSKEKYERRWNAFLPFTHSSIRQAWDQWKNNILRHPRRSFIGNTTENAIGNHLFNAKNVSHCFDSTDIEDVRYSTNMRGARDCMDINYWGHPGEQLYDCLAVGEGATRMAFCIGCWGGCENLYYCHICIACRDCFGCKGLRHKRYCIFNQQYTKEEYETLVPKMIAKMRESGDWGEMFSVAYSDFPYNDTLALEYFPMTKEEVVARGWKWRDQKDEIPKVEKIIPASQLPESIDDIPDDILNWAIECDVTKRPFKIIKQELEFYRQMRLPVPRLHPDERHRKRMALRNPRKLWKRECMKCQKEIETSYAPDRPEIVYCQECYLKEVY